MLLFLSKSVIVLVTMNIRHIFIYEGSQTMKQWITPDINELNLKDTAWVDNGDWSHDGWVNSGDSYYVDLNANVPVITPAPGQDDNYQCGNGWWNEHLSDELSS